MRFIRLFILLILLQNTLSAQKITQTIRGTVTEKISQHPLPGVSIILVGSEPLTGTVSDAEGQFRLKDVPIGKHSLKFVYMGFEEQIISNLDIKSGKETVLQVSMEEKIIQNRGVTIFAEHEKNKAMNEMAMVNTRTFSVEETQKYAAAVNDPARMATSFAGVSSGDDGNNIISIRGNAPHTLQWRMEGVEIPNPNHFSAPGTSGGGISILSSQLLYNSDFLNGASPAEYGNALSGVFDLRLRKGNNEKKEFTMQAGFLGIDLAAEGPFSKKYNGSYLINYRYSTLGALQNLVPIGDAKTLFQDVSFNIYLPTKNSGSFGIFGFGGWSSSRYEAKKDSLKWEDEGARYSSDYTTGTGALGINNALTIGQNTFLKSAVVVSLKNAGDETLRLNDALTDETRFKGTSDEGKMTLTSVLTHKINSRHSFRSGIILNRFDYKINYLDFDYDSKELKKTIYAKGNTGSCQGFVAYTFKISEKFTAQGGFHYQYFLYNKTSSPEERASLRYTWNKKQSITFGYGRHGQLQPIGVYFASSADSLNKTFYPNKSLGFTKALHYILSYDRMLNSYTHLKTEIYYQSLYKIPVSPEAGNTFSMVNHQFDFITDPLVNKGKGRNKGIELTLEQYLYKDFYYLLSASLFEAKYRALDQVWRNTRYNSHYVLTFTSGKEIKTGARFKNRILGINIKVVYSGGQRSTPINVEASLKKGETVYIEEKAFTLQNPAYFRTDLRFSLKRNRLHATHTVSLDIQNATNRKNIYGEYFDLLSGKIKTYYQTPLIPVFSYRIEF